MNKTTLAVIVAAVVVGGYFLFFRGAYQPSSPVSQPSSQRPVSQPPASEPSAEQQPSQAQSESLPRANGYAPAAPSVPAENRVTYTDSGYSPAVLNVKVGTTVTFKNQSSQLMWTASAVHPTHRVYPTTGGCLGSTFDACGGIQPGDSWSFKFDIAGTWKYHNHLNSGDTGTIVVE